MLFESQKQSIKQFNINVIVPVPLMYIKLFKKSIKSSYLSWILKKSFGDNFFEEHAHSYNINTKNHKI